MRSGQVGTGLFMFLVTDFQIRLLCVGGGDEQGPQYQIITLNLTTVR